MKTKDRLKYIMGKVGRLDVLLTRITDAMDAMEAEEGDKLDRLEGKIREMEAADESLSQHVAELTEERDELLGIIRKQTEELERREDLITELRRRASAACKP